MGQKTKGIVHNAFYTRNERKESLNSLFGLSKGSDMDIYNFEFDKDGSLIVIPIKKNVEEGRKLK
ncbi:MAG: hypothetical protein NC307_00290 [Roseburia sp.]|nr:hypothetical protein [Roseburia sp.]